MTSQEITRQNQNLKDLIFTLKEKEHWERSRRLTEQSILAFSDQSWMKEITQVILVGHGTSLASTMTAEIWFGHLAGVQAHAMAAYHFLRNIDDYLPDPMHTLVIGLSTGGNTESVIRSVIAAKERGAVSIGAAGEKDSELARAGSFRLISAVDEDNSQIPGKEFGGGYSVSHSYAMLALLLLALKLGHEKGALDDEALADWQSKLDQTLDAIATSMDSLFARMAQITHDLDERKARSFVVIGSGANLGTVREGALKICEFTWDFGAPEDLEDLHHGRFRELGPEHIIFILCPDERDYPKTMDILTGAQYSHSPTVVLTGCPTEAMKRLADHVVPMPPVEENLSPFLYILPLWFYGFERAAMDGMLVGDRRYGLWARDINFRKHYNEDGTPVEQN